MAKYKTPGIYIQQISPNPPSVAQVETAIPAFIGYTEKAKSKVKGDLLNVAKKIKSIEDYKKYFGDADSEKGITVQIDTQQTPVEIIAENVNPSNYLMYYALQAYYFNGGGPCYIVSVGDYSGGGVISQSALLGGLAKAGKVDEVTLNVFPDGVNMEPSMDYYAVVRQSLSQCNSLKNRFTVCDVVMHNNPNINDVDVFRNSLVGPVYELKYGAAYYPYLEMMLDYPHKDKDVTVVKDGVVTDLNHIKEDDLILYNIVQRSIKSIPLVLPPAAAMAGIYVQVDSNRGVWKAPANVSLAMVIKPTVNISSQAQETLNVDAASGKSINAIRTFPGKGPMVWGARTLAGNDNEWRYISVRRLFIMVEESIKKATEQFVFEPNDRNTWVRIKAMIENFLFMQWKAGALAGPTPHEASYVKVGLGETMTENDIQTGKLYIEIGMAPLRPSEFIVLKIKLDMQLP